MCEIFTAFTNSTWVRSVGDPHYRLRLVRVGPQIDVFAPHSVGSAVVSAPMDNNSRLKIIFSRQFKGPGILDSKLNSKELAVKN